MSLSNRRSLCRASVERVAELLPPEDAELDALITEIALDNNLKAFLHAMGGARWTGAARGGAASVRGASLLGHPRGRSVMFKVQGDVPEQMMAAKIENSQLPFPVEAGVLLALQDWLRQFRGETAGTHSLHRPPGRHAMTA